MIDTCHAGDKAAALFIQHPKLIVEVLSDSTQAYDSGAKFVAYRKIDSLEEYVLVNIERRSVESFRRQADERWLLRDFAVQESCVLESVALTLSMARLFEDVEPMKAVESLRSIKAG